MTWCALYIAKYTPCTNQIIWVKSLWSITHFLAVSQNQNLSTRQLKKAVRKVTLKLIAFVVSDFSLLKT